MNIVYTDIYQYILVYNSYPLTGFRGGHRDAAVLDASQPPVEQEPEEGDPSPCPEDEEFFVRPDAAGMEEASGFEEMHRFLATLPVPAPKKGSEMTHAEALEGQLLPNLDEEQRKRFTPTELIMYRHAQDYRY